ncbi:hypothetical protein TD95_000138, partial [Thielaviopsis punctulata]
MSVGSLSSLAAQLESPGKKLADNSLASAYDSETFDQELSFSVPGRVGSATISPCGRDIALASSEGLVIVDLDDPYKEPRRLSTHGMPWLVVDAQWSPFASRDYWVVSTANHRALVWNLNMKEDSVTGAIEHSLEGHSRAITDINFSAHHPDILSTCSVDGTVHCWDLRRPRKPTMTFFDWVAGATQVKFSRQDNHILTSAHDRTLHIWDDRKACEPVRSILAHSSKIYGIDWNRTRADELITCSLDKTIKFWDLSGPTEEYLLPRHVIQTDYPVWRARHTPFGNGIMAIPQNEPGDLYIYSTPTEIYKPIDVRPRTQPVQVFEGHGQKKVKEFLWRARGSIGDDQIDAREFQLISWGEDNKVRMQKPRKETLRAVGYVHGTKAPKGLCLTRKGAMYRTFNTVDHSNPRDTRVAPTMSDLRPRAPAGNYSTSAITAGLQNVHKRSVPGWRSAMTAKSRHGSKSAQSSIGWMKGVKVQQSVSVNNRRLSSKDSTVFEAPDEDWQKPEPIREEIIRISTELPKLRWDQLNPANTVVSLQGPWGQNKSNIYFKVHIDIPAGYPQTEALQFAIDRTIYMDTHTHAKLESDIQMLAQRFQEIGKNSLHAIFSYLLGDVDLQTTQARYFETVGDLRDLANLNEGDSSSSDDEDNATEMRASSTLMSMDMTTSVEAHNSFATNNPISRTALPIARRTCGARFSHNGQLVCFFPTQEEKTRAIFQTAAADASNQRKTADPYSTRFGRMAFESPLRRRMSDYGSESDDVDGGSSGSEYDVSTSEGEGDEWDLSSMPHIGAGRLRIAWSETHSVHSSGGGTGIGTATGTGVGRRRTSRPKYIVSLHDVSGVLPSKKNHAQFYEVYGDDVCKHNAQVAERFGHYELRDVWHFCGLLLHKGIPLEVLDRSLDRARGRDRARSKKDKDKGGSSGDSPEENVLVVARHVASGYNDEYSGMMARVKWGSHPMARHFVDGLFDYYERTANVQMLALLSCIFVEPTLPDNPEDEALANPYITQPAVPLACKAPGFSQPFYNSRAAFERTRAVSQTASVGTSPSHTLAMTPVLISGSANTNDDTVSTSDPFAHLNLPIYSQAASRAHSIGGTPPARTSNQYTRDRDFSNGELEPPSQMHSEAPSLSASPNTRSFWKQSSFTAHIPRAIATAMSSSPPSLRKKASPAESSGVNTNSNSNVTWGHTTIMGASSGSGAAAGWNSITRPGFSEDGKRRMDLIGADIGYTIQTFVEDQSIFDDDSACFVTPLLNPSRNHLYANYRYAYAELLQMWELPLQRLEILKFNVLQNTDCSFALTASETTDKSLPYSEPSESKSSPSASSIPVLLGRQDALHSLSVAQRGLDVTGICRIHELQLKPINYRSTPTTALTGGAIGVCPRCNEIQRQLRCVYCLGPLDAQYTPCLACGCAAHDACLAEWHAAGEELCPAGDECNCVEEASSGHVETWEAMMGALGRTRRPTASLAPSGVASPISAALKQQQQQPMSRGSTASGPAAYAAFAALDRGPSALRGPGHGLGYAADDSWETIERDAHVRGTADGDGLLHMAGQRAARASMGAHDASASRFAFRSKLKKQSTGVWARTQVHENLGEEMAEMRRPAERSVSDMT